VKLCKICKRDIVARRAVAVPFRKAAVTPVISNHGVSLGDGSTMDHMMVCEDCLRILVPALQRQIEQWDRMAVTS
jgi:hypothetical protein